MVRVSAVHTHTHTIGCRNGNVLMIRKQGPKCRRWTVSVHAQGMTAAYECVCACKTRMKTNFANLFVSFGIKQNTRKGRQTQKSHALDFCYVIGIRRSQHSRLTVRPTSVFKRSANRRFGKFYHIFFRYFFYCDLLVSSVWHFVW